MKKFVILLMLAALLAGCGAQGGGEPVREDSPEPEQTHPAGEAAVPEEGDIMIPIG